MITVFFVALVVVGYTYAGYPLLIALLARIRPAPWVRGPVSGSASIILAVHNGMALLPAKIDCLLQMDPSLIHEIIVVVDGGDDGAAEWLGGLDAARVRTLVLPRHEGKSAALRRGMESATSDFLLFVDVRPEITESAIRKLLSNFADPRVGCAAGELQVRTSATGAAASVGGLYWRYEQWIRTCESTYKSPVGVYGGFYAVRRSLAVLPPPGLILDDMFQPLWIIRRGFRNIIDVDAIVVDHWPATSSGEFRRKVRTLAGNFQLCAQQPWLLTPRNPVLLQLVSHKLLRLAVPYCFIAMMISSGALAIHSTTWAIIAFAQAFLLLVGTLGHRVPFPALRRVSSALGALLLLNAAAVWALWTYLTTRGPLWKIWRPTAAPVQPPLT